MRHRQTRVRRRDRFYRTQIGHLTRDLRTVAIQAGNVAMNHNAAIEELRHVLDFIMNPQVSQQPGTHAPLILHPSQVPGRPT